jgi:formamidopyrimidine-DNA glycosylase
MMAITVQHMPELPDITVYIEALEARVLGRTLDRIRLGTPFLLRTVEPPLKSVDGQKVKELRRVGKRIGFGLENGIWVVLHLMIAGRLHWTKPNTKLPGKRGLAAFDFENGTLLLTEAGSKRRASLHLVSGERQLFALDPGGIDIFATTLDQFQAVLRSENHTLKRSLTDPHFFSGIGNAYSDEILHRARLSPVALTQKLSDEQIESLWIATRSTMLDWIGRLRDDARGEFPEKVTAFRKDMAVHGRYGLPCPDCGSTIQRIRYADNETNYCPQCQTGGKLLADRGLSRLLKSDWPKTLEEMEMRLR